MGSYSDRAYRDNAVVFLLAVMTVEPYHCKSPEVVLLSNKQHITFNAPSEEGTDELIAFVSDASFPELLAPKFSIPVIRGMDRDRSGIRII